MSRKLQKIKPITKEGLPVYSRGFEDQVKSSYIAGKPTLKDFEDFWKDLEHNSSIRKPL